MDDGVRVDISSKLYRRQDRTGGGSNDPEDWEKPMSGIFQPSEKTDENYQFFKNAPNNGIGLLHNPVDEKYNACIDEVEDMLDDPVRQKKRSKYGLRIQTLPTNMKMEITQMRMHDRMMAFDNETFITYAKYTGEVKTLSRDLILSLIHI